MEISRCGGKFCFSGTMFLLTVLLSACSMQNSGSKLDATRTDQNQKVTKNLLQQNDSQEKVGLYIVQSNVLVRDYPIGLGLHPQGDKEKEGDGRTPEGEFKICTKAPAGRFGKSLVLNYPDKKHAERAFFAGILSPSEFRDILVAREAKEKPPLNPILGKEISIHSGGAHQDWTNGCVALYASDMDELFSIAGIGTPVSIRP